MDGSSQAIADPAVPTLTWGCAGSSTSGLGHSTKVQLPNFSPLILLFLLNDSVVSFVSVAPKMQLRIEDAKNTGLKKPSAWLVIREGKYISYRYPGNKQDILILNHNSVTGIRCFSDLKTYRNETDPMNTVSDKMTPYLTCKTSQKIYLSETC